MGWVRLYQYKYLVGKQFIFFDTDDNDVDYLIKRKKMFIEIYGIIPLNKMNIEVGIRLDKGIGINKYEWEENWLEWSGECDKMLIARISIEL